MVEAKNKWWLVENNNAMKATRSSWLQSTLSDLDEKTKAMLKIVEEDADSFAQRAEMYYRKRPELISMVEEFYRSHRSLAERYDQLKSDSGSRLATPWAPSLSFTKYRGDKLICSTERSYDSYSETYEPEESSGDSEVDDPEPVEESKCDNEVDNEVSSEDRSESEEVLKLREEIAKLKEENKLQEESLLLKDEEKREAIRQLSFTVDMLKEDNMKLRKLVAAKETPKKQSPIDFIKSNEGFWGKIFNGSPQRQVSVVRSLELV
ncbi:protein NETWORKED 3A isoform X1 [Daucus carota subsp. sativus]|uniref:NAB domain-containing protein n=2 Tax=Daucus carota subsp. sativus TaxID=79200 RepID=A0A166CEM3_DAUCS|nr:PREDICTED: protein NETWORKED 3A isoform X1 [Daucus carota subsp. sativus]